VRAYGHGLFAKTPVDGSGTTYRAFNQLYTGAVVLSQVKGWEGAIAVCPESLANWYVSPEYRTFRCRQNMAVSEYIAVLVESPWFWTKLRTLTRGVGGRRERTRPEAFLALEMPMPTAEQQMALVDVLEKVGAVRSMRSGTPNQLDALSSAVLDRAFNEGL
jgi:type I restriction enzyme, S subunit